MWAALKNVVNLSNALHLGSNHLRVKHLGLNHLGVNHLGLNYLGLNYLTHLRSYPSRVNSPKG